MSNLSETGTEAFDYFVSMVDDPAARCKIETLLLDIERESYEKGLEDGEQAKRKPKYPDYWEPR